MDTLEATLTSKQEVETALSKAQVRTDTYTHSLVLAYKHMLCAATC